MGYIKNKNKILHLLYNKSLVGCFYIDMLFFMLYVVLHVLPKQFFFCFVSFVDNIFSQ